MVNCRKNDEYNFYVLSCDEGEYITSYTDDKDIKEFSSFTIAYAPLNSNISIYRAISSQENEEYERRKREAIEEDERGRL